MLVRERPATAICYEPGMSLPGLVEHPSVESLDAVQPASKDSDDRECLEQRADGVMEALERLGHRAGWPAARRAPPRLVSVLAHIIHAQDSTHYGSPIMDTYRPRPVTAVQWWTGVQIDGLTEEPPHFVKDPFYGRFWIPRHAILTVPKGWRRVEAGDWIVTRPDGTRRVLTDASFEHEYEQVA
jgi:hypothetical protein